LLIGIDYLIVSYVDLQKRIVFYISLSDFITVFVAVLLSNIVIVPFDDISSILWLYFTLLLLFLVKRIYLKEHVKLSSKMHSIQSTVNMTLIVPAFILYSILNVIIYS